MGFNKQTRGYKVAIAKAPFIKGPIPIPWLSEAAGLPGKTIQVALALWWISGMSGTSKIKLTAAALRTFHLSQDASRDGLRRLADRGLITLDRRPGQRHLCTLNTATDPRN